MNDTITALIIDDELSARQVIRELIKQYSQRIEIIAEANNAETGLSAILKHQPQIVFLDIQMPGQSGFDLLKELPEINFKLIIITAHEKYAIRAIKASALDYLLKPINIPEFQKTIYKIEKTLKAENDIRHQILLQNIKAAQLQKVIVPTEQGWHVVSVSDIISCQADSVYTHIFIRNQNPILSSKPLKVYENLLPKHAFIRVHKSHIIHLQYVKKYIKGKSGQVEMTDGSIIAIARQRKNDFLRLLNSFTFQS